VKSVTLAERVIATIAKSREIPAESIRVESTFEELGLDSLDSFEILYALEQEFDVVIPDESARGLRTVGDIVERLAVLAPASGASEVS
jgi:acyl carrier protein